MVDEKEWDASFYDSKHSYITKYGDNLIDLLSPRRGERILDLGCGTGHLTHRIAESGAAVVGIDSAPDMVETARRRYPDLEFERMDGADFRFDEPFDAVFSNAAIHWMKPPEGVAASISRALKPGGRVVAELGGRGNIRRVMAGIARGLHDQEDAAGPDLNPWYFPSIGQYASLLEAHGLSVEYAILFDRPTPLDDGGNGMRNWLEMFASGILKAIPDDRRPAVIGAIERELRPVLYRDGTWYADYVRLRVVAIKG